MKSLPTVRRIVVSLVMPAAWAFASALQAAQNAPAAGETSAGPAMVAVPPVPNGDAAALFAYIDEVKKLKPAGNDLPSVVAHLTKTHSAVIAAAEKVGANASETEQTRAIVEKLNSLQLLRRLEADGAETRMKQYLAALATDRRPFVSPLAKVYELAGRLQELDHGDHATVEKLLQDVRTHVRTAKPDARNLAIALQTAIAAEGAGLTKQATEAYVEFAAAFALSDDKQVVENAERLAGAARMLTLVGNSLEIKGKTLDGKPFDWAKYRGKIVLVDFWATWCGPCIAELPTLRDCYRAYRERGFEVVGISLDEDRARLQAFVEREELPWPVLFDDDPKSGGWNHPLAVYYGVLAIPRAILVDRQGKAISVTAHGEALWDLLAKELGPIEPKPAEPKVAEPKAAEPKSSNP